MTNVNEELIVYRLDELSKTVSKISETQDKIMEKINSGAITDATREVRLDNLEAEVKKSSVKYGGIAAGVVTPVVIGVVEAIKQLWHR